MLHQRSYQQSAKIQERYEHLIAQLEDSFHNPKKRLKLANELFLMSQEEIPSPQLKLDILQKSVYLDPFSLCYRIALAKTEYELGLLKEAISEYQHALAYWPNSPEVNLLLGVALLDTGRVEEAKTYFEQECFDQLPPKSLLKLKVIYNRIECDLREAKEKKHWKKIIQNLGTLEINSVEIHEVETLDLVGLFCEKCLKILIECGDEALCKKVLELAQQTIDKQYRDHPAYQLLQSISQFNPQECFKNKVTFRDKAIIESSSSKLEELLHAYLLTNQTSLENGNSETRIESVGLWQSLVDQKGDAWFGLRDAYLHELDGWATQAYNKKSLTLARTLWEEAERVSPYNPAVLKNLAITYTRLKEEKGYEHYWNRLTKIWTLHSEMLPEADGYGNDLLQKHQAFIEGAQQKLQTSKTWEELLELGSIWIKEAVSFLALRQLSFRNPYFRCGVMVEDWRDEEERQELLEIGYESIEQWLELIVAWQELGESSSLAQWRRHQLIEAKRIAVGSSEERYYFYDEEKEAFQHYREYMLNNYILLLFRVLQEIATQKIEHKEVSQQYAILGKGLMSFPHRLLESNVLKVIEQLETEIDLKLLVHNYATTPWINLSQQALEQKQWCKALGHLDFALSISPDLVSILFYKALCHFNLEEWNMTEWVARKTLTLCQEEDQQVKKQLELMLEQLPQAKVAKDMADANKAMEQEEWQRASLHLDKALSCLDNFSSLNLEQSLDDFSSSNLKLGELKLIEPIGLELELEPLKPIDSNQLIQASYLKHILDVLESYRRSLKPNSSTQDNTVDEKIQRPLRQTLIQIVYYMTLCYFKLGEWDAVEQVSTEIMLLCQEEDQQVKKQLELMLEQLPQAKVAKDMADANKAMEQESWHKALNYLNSALSKSPDIVHISFYKALCHFRLEEWNEAEQVARAALSQCKKEDRQAKEQIQLILKQIPTAKYTAKANEAFKQEQWQKALSHLGTVLSIEPDNPEAHFLKALALFRETMNDINSQKVSPTQSMFEPVESALKNAMKYVAKNSNLSSQIRDLQKNVKQVRNQLRLRGIR